MTTPKVHHLRSSTQGKLPAAAGINVGQIGINFNSADPFLCVKDSDGVVRRVSGATISATAPLTPVNGQLWVDITTATSPVAKNWNGTAWAPLAGDLHVSATQPGSPAKGTLWVDISGATPALKIYDGSAWVASGGQVSAATTTTLGTVRLADATAVTAGTAERVVDAAQLKEVRDSLGSTYLSNADAASTYAPKANPTFTGTVTIPAGASISGYLTTANASSTYQPISGMSSYLMTADASSTYQPISGMSSYARLASPAFTGTPTAPTASAGTNTTQLATTAFVTTAVAAGGGGSSVPNATTSTYGIVLLADTAAVNSGTSGRIVDAAQVKAAYQTLTGMSSYQTTAGMSSYLTTSSANSTYQSISGMASYLTTSAASTTYMPRNISSLSTLP
jgi:hypothetical protein